MNKDDNRIIRNDVLIDDTYDGFKELVNDGRDQSRYTNFRVSNFLGLFGFMKVEKDELAIVVDRVDPDKVEVLGTGLYPITIKKKFLYVPHPPKTPIIVDFVPKNEEDKKMNFTFTPNWGGDLKDGQDEVFIDYRLHLRWSGDYERDKDRRIAKLEESVLRYYYTVNPMQNIQATIVSLLREFVSKSGKSELVASGISLEKVDPNSRLRNLAHEYGLEVVDFDVKNIKLSEAVQEAKNKAAASIEEAAGRREVAKIDKETAKINAKAGTAGFKEGVKFATEKLGFSKEDPRTLYLLKLLNDKELAKTAKAYIVNGSDNGRMNLDSWLALYGDKALSDKDASVIEADYSEVSEEGRGRKR